jgi:hypothetical protein
MFLGVLKVAYVSKWYPTEKQGTSVAHAWTRGGAVDLHRLPPLLHRSRGGIVPVPAAFWRTKAVGAEPFGNDVCSPAVEKPERNWA